MARIPMVTRTITSTKAIILCVDTESGQTMDKEYILPRTYKSNEDALKKAVELSNGESVKPVHVKSLEVIEDYYGITEEEFVKVAHIVPKPTKKEAE